MVGGIMIKILICEDIDEECYMALKTIVKEYEKNN